MTPEHRQILLEALRLVKQYWGRCHAVDCSETEMHTLQETGCDVDWAPDEAKAFCADLLDRPLCTVLDLLILYTF